jgi:hypothetical protein
MKRVHLLVGLLVASALPARADDTYQVSKTDAVVTVGSKGKASVTISAKRGWHLNAEAPLTLKLGNSPGLQTDKPKLGRSDLALSTKTQARFDVGVTAAEPGRKTLEAEAGFVLCQESACRPVKERISLAVDANAAKPAEPGKKKARKR